MLEVFIDTIMLSVTNFAAKPDSKLGSVTQFYKPEISNAWILHYETHGHKTLVRTISSQIHSQRRTKLRVELGR